VPNDVRHFPVQWISNEALAKRPAKKILFLECGGNSGSEWAEKTGVDVQRSYGLVSGSEWTGVPLSTLLKQTGLRPGAAWVLAERNPAHLRLCAIYWHFLLLVWLVLLGLLTGWTDDFVDICRRLLS